MDSVQNSGNDPPAEIPLTEHDIRRWVGEAAFGRGLSYYQGGYILEPRRQESTLHARCSGTEEEPYRLRVTLDPQGIVEGDCTCYVGAGGRCKHVAALLLTWLHAPEQFEEQGSRSVKRAETLQERSKPELIDLIQRMLARYPDLEPLLDAPLALDTEHLPPLDVNALQKQVGSAFYGGDDRGPGKVVPHELAWIVQLGDAYAGRARWDDAARIYQAVIRPVLNRCDWEDDESCEMIPIVDDCVVGLGECLKRTQDRSLRDPILHALFDVYHWSAEHTQVELGAEAPLLLLQETSAEEKERIAGWVREVMPTEAEAEGSWSDRYLLHAHGGFLLDLQAETLEDAEYLRICRETGRWPDLVERLLVRGQVEEATAIARERDDPDLLTIADLLVAQGLAPLAEELVQERTQTSRYWHLKSWLKERALARGDLVGALAVAEEQFWERPDQGGYRELRDLHRQLGQWEVQREAILARLGEEGRHRLLTELYLQAGELDRALEALGPVAMNPSRGIDDLSLRVAEAAEETRPRAALMLYTWLATCAIRERNRSAYATAAHQLTHVRTLYYRLGEPEAWEDYITNLRDEHRRLRALQDELNKAGIE